MKRASKCVSEMEGWAMLAVSDDPVDQIEPLDGIDKDLIRAFSSALTVVWEFLAAGCTSDSRAHRVWAVLYVMRPDLIDGETQAAYARRKGCSRRAVERYVSEFRAVLASAVDQIGSEGKESLMRPAGRPGSASCRPFTRENE